MIENGSAGILVSPMPKIGNSTPSTFSVLPVEAPEPLDCARANDGIALSPRKGGRAIVGEAGEPFTLFLLLSMLLRAVTGDFKDGAVFLWPFGGRRGEAHEEAWETV